MLPIVAKELISARPEWREMTTHIRTVATQAFQLWLRPDEPTLGWHEPGVTSVPISDRSRRGLRCADAVTEDWPDDDRPGTVAYFCEHSTRSADEEVGAGYARRYEQVVRREATSYVDRHLAPYFPVQSPTTVRVHLLSGVNGLQGQPALTTQHVSVTSTPLIDTCSQSLEQSAIAYDRRKWLRQLDVGG